MGYQLELIEVAKHYKDFIAVDNVSLQIEKGEIVSFLGASGCGKTTTLRMVAGLIEPTHGSVFIAGQNMQRVPPHKRDISMVFQNYALFPHLTVFENIVYGLRMRGVRDKTRLAEQARRMMDIVQLTGVESRLPRELSGGQQQRVSLARAMIVEPRVMLFDEPLSNLDAKLREQTRVEIRNLLKSMNVTALYVTHDQEEALTISDRIAVMNRGRIEQITTPTQLYTAPATRFIAGFVGHANFFDGLVAPAPEGQLALRMVAGQKLLARAPAHGAPPLDSPATLVCRPENTRLLPAGQAGNNRLPGTVKARIYLGSTVRYIVDTGEGRAVEIDLHTTDEVYPEGAAVTVAPDEASLILVQG